MNPDSVIARWVELEFHLDFDELPEDMQQYYRSLHAEMVLPQPTYSERLLDLLSHALERAWSAQGCADQIRSAMNLIRTHDAIAIHARLGKLRVVESGRDCDGVEYSGREHIIDATLDATLDAFEKLHDDISEWADGPFRLEVVSFTDKVEYESRDLVMEAHENGHRHSIVSRFP